MKDEEKEERQDIVMSDKPTRKENTVLGDGIAGDKAKLNLSKSVPKKRKRKRL